MAGREVDWGEVQGIVLSSYKHKPEAAYFLLTIDRIEEARHWFRNELRTGNISFRDDRSPVGPSLNLAFTFAGLARLGLPETALKTFPWDFRDGMTSPLRQRILADREHNDPKNWAWGGDDASLKDLHVLVIVYAPNKKELHEFATEFKKGWGTAFHPIVPPSTGYRPKNQREHFGFLDGLSQPAIESSPRARRFRKRGDLDDIVRPGEFILGYVNERGQLPVSPSLAMVPGTRLPVITNADRSVSGYPKGTEFPRLDFGRNGTFLVYRQLEQNVMAFDRLIKRAEAALGDGRAPRLNDEAPFRRLLAAKIIGRWDDGTSLALSPNKPTEDGQKAANDAGDGGLGASRKVAPAEGDIAKEAAKSGDVGKLGYGGVTDEVLAQGGYFKTVNNFGYAEEDSYGLRCPIGSHVRRANPRDTLEDDPQLSIRRNNRHRLLRRGRLYGRQTHWHAWDPDTVERTEDNIERGLHFVAINASIESQFEFVQQTWMNTPFFGGLTDELDPLMGVPEHGKPRQLTIQGAPINRRISWEEPLVTVRGGAYFFLPSRAALEFLADAKLMAAI
jgi:deferrochelatase/peroxidase EfeB